MGFAGSYHYGRDICRGMDESLNEVEQYGNFIKGFWNVLPFMAILMLCLSSTVESVAVRSVMKLFSLLNIEQSYSFFSLYF